MSARETLRSKLLSLLEEEMGESFELPQDDQDLRETLGLDSVDLVGLVMRIEREFHVRLAPEELALVKRVGDLLDLMEAKLAEMDAAGRQALSTQGFEQVARRMARLMQGRFDLGFVDVGGWDTHVNQGNTTGQLANNLANLGKGLAAYADALGDEWNNTVVVVVSEFGRTFRENGNKGTDHGHGTVYWVLGGKVNGGRIAGQQLAVNAQSLLQNRDYPVLNEYRAVFGGLFARM